MNYFVYAFIQAEYDVLSGPQLYIDIEHSQSALTSYFLTNSSITAAATMGEKWCITTAPYMCSESVLVRSSREQKWLLPLHPHPSLYLPLSSVSHPVSLYLYFSAPLSLCLSPSHHPPVSLPLSFCLPVSLTPPSAFPSMVISGEYMYHSAEEVC